MTDLEKLEKTLEIDLGIITKYDSAITLAKINDKGMLEIKLITYDES